MKGPEVRRKPGRPRLSEPSPEYQSRRIEIVETAARVFHQRGYDAGTLDDVASALDLRTASLYYYVSSKAELLHLIFDQALGYGLERLRLLETGSDDPRERLAELIRHQAITIASEPSLFTVFFDERSRLDARYEDDIRAKERQYLDVFASAVRSALEDGVLAGMDPRYAGQALLGMTTWVYKWLSPEQHEPTDFAQTCVSLVVGS